MIECLIFVLGKGNLQSPGSVTFLHPNPNNEPGGPTMSIACLDHDGICVFNPVTNKMIWEVKLDNKPRGITSASKKGLGNYMGLWYVEKDKEKYLVTFNRYKKCLMYFLPYAHDQDEHNPKEQHPVHIDVDGYTQQILHNARFGAYDEENCRFVFSLNIKSDSMGTGHCKKVVVFDRRGRLDKNFGSTKTGIQNVPPDVGQLAGICPVIGKKFHGYIMLDAQGHKVMHMSKYGHIKKVCY